MFFFIFYDTNHVHSIMEPELDLCFWCFECFFSATDNVLAGFIFWFYFRNVVSVHCLTLVYILLLELKILLPLCFCVVCFSK